MDTPPGHDEPQARSRPSRHRVAVLIAAEAVETSDVPDLLAAVTARYGRPAIRRVYADWTGADCDHHVGEWSQAVRDHGVQPIHTMSSGTGATSVALSLDALDIVQLYGLTCVVLAGDQGELQPLVTRLRARGIEVATSGPAPSPDSHPDGDHFITLTGAGSGTGSAVREVTTFTGLPGRHRREV